MLGCRDRASFVQELVFEGGVDGKRRIEHLDRDVALEERIARAENGGEPSLAEERAELELVAEGCLELWP
jgi:hypothetical protein